MPLAKHQPIKLHIFMCKNYLNNPCHPILTRTIVMKIHMIINHPIKEVIMLSTFCLICILSPLF
jgi:hypothetical protein